MTANELDIKVFDRLKRYDIGPNLEHYEKLAYGQQMEIRNQTGNSHLYYQWLTCLVQELNPKQIVELGAAAGISTISFALGASPECKIYSVDIDPEIAWMWMKYDYPNVTKLLGDDLNMEIWPKDVELGETDLWFLDSLHTKEQLSAEIELYGKYWKNGDVVVFDDIRMEELWPIWEALPYDKCENTNPNHYTGFGFCII